MNDSSANINTALLTQTALTSVISTRLWPDRVTPLEGYTPEMGGGITFRIRGGTPLYRGSMAGYSVQFLCWGVDSYTATLVYRTLFDVLNDKAFSHIRSAYVEQMGQPIEDQSTGWPAVLVYFTIWLAI